MQPIASDATTIDLNQLAAFVRVVEAKSFTGAASSLGLRKSSVSRAVSRLEDDLGVKLLHRTTRSITLTDAGRAYFERVRAAISGVEEATAEVRELGLEPRGLVRLTVLPIEELSLPLLLNRFTRAHPKIHVEVMMTMRRVDLVEENVDIAIRAGRVEDATLIGRKVASDHLGVFAASSYCKRRGRPKTLKDLAQHDCVMYRPEQGKTRWRLEGPKGPETVEVSGPIGVDDMNFVRDVVVSGGGIGLLPHRLIPRATLESGEVVRLFPEYQTPTQGLYIVSPASRQHVARVKVLRDFLVENLRNLWAES